MVKVGIPFNTVAQHRHFHRHCGVTSDSTDKRGGTVCTKKRVRCKPAVCRAFCDILGEVPATRIIDDGVMPHVCEELIRVACGVHSSLPLLLLPRHEEDVYEGEFLKAFLILFQLVKISLRNTTQLEEDTPSGGALATVDMPVHDDGHGLLLEVDRHVQPIKNPPVSDKHLRVASDDHASQLSSGGLHATVGFGHVLPTSRLLGCIDHSVTRPTKSKQALKRSLSSLEPLEPKWLL